MSLSIAYFLGRKRQIGSINSFVFCITLSPILGFIITMLSRKYYSDTPKPSLLKRGFGWFFAILAIFLMFSTILDTGYDTPSSIGSLFFQLGLGYLGYYLIELGKGKRFDDDFTITQIDSEL